MTRFPASPRVFALALSLLSPIALPERPSTARQTHRLEYDARLGIGERGETTIAFGSFGAGFYPLHAGRFDFGMHVQVLALEPLESGPEPCCSMCGKTVCLETSPEGAGGWAEYPPFALELGLPLRLDLGRVARDVRIHLIASPEATLLGQFGPEIPLKDGAPWSTCAEWEKAQLIARRSPMSRTLHLGGMLEVAMILDWVGLGLWATIQSPLEADAPSWMGQKGWSFRRAMLWAIGFDVQLHAWRHRTGPFGVIPDGSKSNGP